MTLVIILFEMEVNILLNAKFDPEMSDRVSMLDAWWNHTQCEIFICEIVLFRLSIHHGISTLSSVAYEFRLNKLEWNWNFVWFDAEHLIAGPGRSGIRMKQNVGNWEIHF